MQGFASACVFCRHDRGVARFVHSDDFTASGPSNALDWFEGEVGNKYEISIGPGLGPGRDDAKESRALNRVIRWTEDQGEAVIEYEADPRQAEKLVKECGLEGAKPMGTPGVKAGFQELEQDASLPQRHHTAFRGAAARGNYLAADRVDVQFATKEVCRSMSAPSEHGWKSLKRIARFLAGRPRLVYRYRQQEAHAIDVYSDTDWGGCPKTRKSTSGGVVMLGSHTIKHWSSTQPSVSLS